MNNETILKEIGLQDKEARVYIAALQLGPASILSLSKHTGIHRPMLYRLLEGLLAKGVFRTTLAKSRKLYVAVEPEFLVKLLDQKKQLLEEALPGLAALAVAGKQDTQTLYFRGKEQLLELYKTGLGAKSKQIYSYFPSKYMLQLFGKKEMEDIIAQRVAKGVHARTLRSVSSESVFEGSDKTGEALRDVRYIPDNKTLRMGVVIFDDTVNLFSPLEENFGIQIKSESFAELMKYFFENLWNTSTVAPNVQSGG